VLHTGLSWGYILAGVFIAALLVMWVTMATSSPTATYGIPLPVVSRSAFGIIGSKLYSLVFLALAVPWSAWVLNVAAKGVYVGLIVLLPQGWEDFNPVRDTSFIQANFITLVVLFFLFLLQLLFFLPGDQVGVLRGVAPSSAGFVISYYISLIVWAYQRPGLGDCIKVSYVITLINWWMAPTYAFDAYFDGLYCLLSRWMYRF